MAGELVADRRLYMDVDRRILIEEGDVRAAFGLVDAGGTISAEDAERLYLTIEDGKIVQHLPQDTQKEDSMRSDNPSSPSSPAPGQPTRSPAGDTGQQPTRQPAKQPTRAPSKQPTKQPGARSGAKRGKNR